MIIYDVIMIIVLLIECYAWALLYSVYFAIKCLVPGVLLCSGVSSLPVVLKVDQKVFLLCWKGGKKVDFWSASKLLWCCLWMSDHIVIFPYLPSYLIYVVDMSLH